MAEDIAFASTPVKRIKGLLGSKDFPDGHAIVIDPCNCIHTLFMRFPIDVLFVGKNDIVVKALGQFTPFKLSKLYWKAHKVVELPCGKIKSTQTQDGDLLQILP